MNVLFQGQVLILYQQMHMLVKSVFSKDGFLLLLTNTKLALKNNDRYKWHFQMDFAV